MRLIDGDALYKKLNNIRKQEVLIHGRSNNKDCCTLSTALSEIDHAPTIELRCEECEAFNKTRLLIPQTERKKAKWIVTTSLQEGQITWRDYKCSNCSHHREKPMNFCEVCGAKMER